MGNSMKTILCFLVLGALALTAAEPKVAGKWSGTFSSTGPEGEARESTALLILKQTGGEITGSFGPSEADQMPITKGRIDGDKETWRFGCILFGSGGGFLTENPGAVWAAA